MEEITFIHLNEVKMLKTFKTAKDGRDYAWKKLDGGFHFDGEKKGCLIVSYADEKKYKEVKKKLKSAGLHVDGKKKGNNFQLGITWVFNQPVLEDINEGKLEFPIVAVANRRPVAVAKNQQQYKAIQKKFQQSNKDNVEFITYSKWKKDYGFSKSDTEIVDRMLRNLKEDMIGIGDVATTTGDMAAGDSTVDIPAAQRKLKKKKKLTRVTENTAEGGAGTGQMGVGNGTGNMSPGTKKITMTPAKRFKGLPVFELDSSDEYHSFSRGVKGFKRWSQHTKSEGVRTWANANRGKDFYVAHNESYTYINRSKSNG